MATRTVPAKVQKILGANWDTVTDLTPFIDSAKVVIDRVVTCAANKGIVLSADEQEILERWLAAHLYAVNDPLYMSRNTDKASGSFQRGASGDGFASTDYGKQALDLDYSMCLKNLNKQQRASVVWLGKPPSAQIPWDQRD